MRLQLCYRQEQRKGAILGLTLPMRGVRFESSQEYTSQVPRMAGSGCCQDHGVRVANVMGSGQVMCIKDIRNDGCSWLA